MISEKKKMKKQKIESGIDKIRKANQILNLEGEREIKPTKFKIEVKGSKKEAFTASHFKLFE